MPVRKMRSVEEAKAPLAARLHPDNLRAAVELSDTAIKLSRSRNPRGLHKYRSLQERAERGTQ